MANEYGSLLCDKSNMCTTEKILTLIDADTNISYEIKVSSEDAEKASRDMIFAHSLLLQAKRYETGEDSPPEQAMECTENLTQSCNAESVDDPEIRQSKKNRETFFLSWKFVHDTYGCHRHCKPTALMTRIHVIDSQGINIYQKIIRNSSEHGSHNWNRAETLLLIASYKEMENDFVLGKMTQKQCWNKVSQIMQTKGININGQKCCTKYQTLKRTYRAISDHNRKSGNSRKTWEYYDVMDELCKNKPWIELLAVAGSSVAGQETGTSETGDEKENRKEKNYKKRINQVFEEYSTKCLQEKKLKREAAERRHEQKLHVLHRMENLLEKMVEKKD